MVEDKFNYDLDFQTNKIKDARIPVQSGAEHDEDAINRKYAKDLVKYDTTLATTLPTTIDVGGLPKNTPSATIANKTFKELFDLVLYPLIPPTYTIPTIVGSITNKDSIITDVGFKENVILNVVPTLNDSSSIVSYTFSGVGITGTITQASPTFTVPNHSLLEGDNTWTVGINYGAATVKNNSHNVPDATGQFIAGTITQDVKITASYPILYGVDYNLNDATLLSSSNIPSGIDCVLPYVTSFDIEVGNTLPASVNIGVPKSNADVRIIMNDIDVTNSFKRAEKSNVKPWENGVGSDYTIFHWYTNMPLDKPTTITVQVYYKFFTSIVDVNWDSQDNKVKIDNGSTALSSWNLVTSSPIPTNPISVGRDVSGNIRIVSTIGKIKRVEKGRPFSITDSLDSTDVMIIDQVGRSQHTLASDSYKFRLWIEGVTLPLFASGLFPSALFA